LNSTSGQLDLDEIPLFTIVDIAVLNGEVGLESACPDLHEAEKGGGCNQKVFHEDHVGVGLLQVQVEVQQPGVEQGEVSQFVVVQVEFVEELVHVLHYDAFSLKPLQIAVYLVFADVKGGAIPLVEDAQESEQYIETLEEHCKPA